MLPLAKPPGAGVGGGRDDGGRNASSGAGGHGENQAVEMTSRQHKRQQVVETACGIRALGAAAAGFHSNKCTTLQAVIFTLPAIIICTLHAIIFTYMLASCCALTCYYVFRCQRSFEFRRRAVISIGCCVQR